MGHGLTKQPAEQFPLAIDFVGNLPTGATVASGTVLAAVLTPATPTTLSSGSAVGATTLTLPVDPKAGAILILDATAITREEAQVQSVAGGGPYTVTLTAPLEQAHAGGGAVQYFPGTQSVLQSAVATIDGAQVIARLKGGQHGRDYRLTYLVVLSSGDVLEEDVTLSVRNQ